MLMKLAGSGDGAMRVRMNSNNPTATPITISGTLAGPSCLAEQCDERRDRHR